MTIIFLGIAWLAGIWLASLVEMLLWTWIPIGAGSIFATILLRRQVSAGLWLAMIGVLCLGTGIEYPDSNRGLRRLCHPILPHERLARCAGAGCRPYSVLPSSIGSGHGH